MANYLTSRQQLLEKAAERDNEYDYLSLIKNENLFDFLMGAIESKGIDVNTYTNEYPEEAVKALISERRNFLKQISKSPAKEDNNYLEQNKPKPISNNSLYIEWEIKSILIAEKVKKKVVEWRENNLGSGKPLNETDAETWLSKDKQKELTVSYNKMVDEVITKTDWDEKQAANYILMDLIPFIPPVRFGYSGIIKKVVINLRVQPGVPTKEVTKQYESAVKNWGSVQKKNKPEKRYKPLNEKTLRILRFVLGTPDKSWADRFNEWHKTYPDKNMKIESPNILESYYSRYKKRFL